MNAPHLMNAARPESRPVRVIGLASMAAAGALVLSACGGDPSAGEAWNDARSKLAEAESFRVSADLPERTPQAAGGPTTGSFDLSGLVTEPNAEMRAEMSGGDVDMTMIVREVGEQGYIKMEQSGDELDEETASMIGLSGKWMEEDIPEDQSGLMKSVHEDLVESLPEEGALDEADSERQEVDRDGGKAYRYEVPAEVREAAAEKEDEGDDDSGGSAVDDMDLSALQAFIVDGDGNLVALELKEADSDETGELSFSDWNSVEKVEAPAEDEMASGPGEG